MSEGPRRAGDATISVVIATRNQAGTLREALDSVLSQIDELCEVIVVDDGSSDETPVILAEYETRDPRIRVLRQMHSGVSAARNRGVLAAAGEFVAFLDSDDRWLPDKIARQRAGSRGADLCFTAYRLVGPSGTEVARIGSWSEEPLSAVRTLLAGCYIQTSTVIVRRAKLLELGGFDETLPVCEDWDLWIRFAATGARMVYVDEPLTLYRVNPNGISRHVGAFNSSAERMFERLFSSSELPAPVRAAKRKYLAGCYLNSAVRSFASGDPEAGRSALARALRARPLSARPGWLRLYVGTLLRSKRSGAAR